MGNTAAARICRAARVGTGAILGSVTRHSTGIAADASFDADGEARACKALADAADRQCRYTAVYGRTLAHTSTITPVILGAGKIVGANLRAAFVGHHTHICHTTAHTARVVGGAVTVNSAGTRKRAGRADTIDARITRCAVITIITCRKILSAEILWTPFAIPRAELGCITRAVSCATHCAAGQEATRCTTRVERHLAVLTLFYQPIPTDSGGCCRGGGCHGGGCCGRSCQS